jgi:hypothetical protein
VYNALKPSVQKLYDNAYYDDDRSSNFNGSITYDANGYLISVNSQDLRKDLSRGYALCSDCSGFGMVGYGKLSNGNINHSIMNTDLNSGTSLEYWVGGGIIQDSLNGLTDLNGNSTFDGDFIEIDPNDDLFNKENGCKRDSFLNFVDLSGNSLAGNNTAENYLTNYNFKGPQPLID